MSTNEPPRVYSIPYALSHDEGEIVRRSGDTLTVKSAGPTFDIALVSSVPNAEPPRDVQDAFDRAFYVLQGGLVVYAGEETFEATPGTFVFMPASVQHRVVLTSKRAELLTIQSPSGGLAAYNDAQQRPADAATDARAQGGRVDRILSWLGTRDWQAQP